MYNVRVKIKKGASRKELKMKVKETRTMQVSFKFGGMAYVSVDIYEGKSLNECLKLRSSEIDGVIIDGLYINIA